MAIARVVANDSDGGATTTPFTLTFNQNPVAGNLLVICIASPNPTGSISAVGWTLIEDAPFQTNSRTATILAKISAGAGDLNVSVTDTGAGTIQWEAFEFSGVPASILQDGTANGSQDAGGTVTTLASPSITLGNKDSLIIFARASSATDGGGNTWTNGTLLAANLRNRLSVAAWLPGSSGAKSSTNSWTSAIRAGLAVAAFKPLATTLSVSNTITVTENVVVSIVPPDLAVNVSDNITVSENISVAPQVGIAISTQITQFIEMSVGLFNPTLAINTPVEIPDIATKLNTADFDGSVSFYFEANVVTNYATGTHTTYAELYNHTDGVAVAGSQVSSSKLASSGDFDRQRSGPITLSGDKVYTVRLKQTDVSSSIQNYISGARIIVVQGGNITKTQIHHQLGYEVTTSSTSNTNRLVQSMQMLYEASRYDGSVTVRHDANLKATSGNTTTSGIYDETAGSLVTSSEVSTTSTTFGIQSSANLTLTDGHVYRPTHYVSAGGTVFQEGNKLVFTITGSPTKFLAYMQAMSYDGGSGGATSTAGYFYPNDNHPLFNTGDFAGGLVGYAHEALIKTSDAAQTATAELFTGIDNAYTDYPASEVAHTGDTTVTRVRSNNFPPPSGALNIAGAIKSSGGGATATLYKSFVVVALTGLPVSDMITVSENVAVTITGGGVVDDSVNVNDTITATENVNLSVNLSISVSDSVTITESVHPEVNSFIAKSDTITVSENVIVTLVGLLAVSDNVTITEAVTLVVPLSINVSDSVTVTEATTVGNTLSVTVSDTITTTDTPKLNELALPSVSDTITTSENVNVTTGAQVSASDTITTSEAVTVVIPGGSPAISVQDTVTITENVSMFGLPLSIAVSDNIAVSESVGMQETVSINVAETSGFNLTNTAVIDTSADYKGLGFGGSEHKIAKNSGGRLFAAYRKKLSSIYEPYIAYSDDGITWTPVNIANIVTDDQRVPSIAVGPDNVIHVVWYGKDPSNTGTNQRQIKYSRSTDNGATYSAWVSVGGDVTGYAGSSLWQEHPTVFVDPSNSSNLYVAWEGRDATNLTAQWIKFSKSTDGGTTWSGWVNVSGAGSRPNIVKTTDGKLHVAYYSSTGTVGTVQQIQHVISTDNGGTWSSPTIIGDTGFDARNVSIIDDGNNLHAVWRQLNASFSTAQIHYSKFTGTWSAPIAISPILNLWQFFSTISMQGTVPTVLWLETNQSSGYTSEDPTAGLIYVSRFYNGAWTPRQQLTTSGTDLYPYLNKNSLDMIYSNGLVTPFNFVYGLLASYDTGFHVSDSVNVTIPGVVADLGVVVTAGIQQINGPQIV